MKKLTCTKNPDTAVCVLACITTCWATGIACSKETLWEVIPRFLFSKY